MIGLAASLMLAAAGPPEVPPGQRAAWEAAAHDLCSAKVALLGEDAGHGDGETLAFKAALVRRLVDRCGFDAVFFEASHYDLLAFGQRVRDGTATPDLLASAIGGLWNGSREFAPLLAFLYEEARAGRVAVGGLDPNLGSRGAFYSLDAMPADLASILPAPRRARCGATLRRRIRYDYPDGYGPRKRAEVLACLAAIERAPAPARDVGRVERAERRWMLANFRRLVAADLGSEADRFAARDFLMFRNLRWLAARLPRDAKLIVWTATVHAAKRGDAAAPFAVNLGAHLRRAYGRGAFALGFSAASGRHGRPNRAQPRPIAAPPTGSLEARALAATQADAVYLDRAALAALGPIAAAPLRHGDYAVRRWDALLDGLVVFRAERPPLPAR